MREVRFRGKRLDNGEWVTGYLVNHHGLAFILETGYPIPNGDFYAPPKWWCAVDPATVGQFTGLKDKNGKQIYAGDIVRQDYHLEREYDEFTGYHVGEVVIVGSKGACMKRPTIYSKDPEPWHTQGYKRVVRSRCEVIGNVWENPELLRKDGAKRDG